MLFPRSVILLVCTSCTCSITTAEDPDSLSLLQGQLTVDAVTPETRSAHEVLGTNDEVFEEEMVARVEALFFSVLQKGEEMLHTNVESAAHKGKLVKQLAIPFVALGVGLICLLGNELLKTFGKILVYFGAQTFMNIYMKAVLSSCVISEAEHLKGFPAAFAVTAIQQVTALVAFLLLFAISQFTPWPYRPKRASSGKELLIILVFSFTFMLNIALNNFSLALLPLSANLIIRSCAPLATEGAQRLVSRLAGERNKDNSAIDVFLMFCGVCCAAVAVVAKAKGKTATSADDSNNLVLGVIMCVASLFAAAINMALAGLLGNMKLNPLDTTLYMSIPVFVFLLVPTFCIPHPSDWPGGLMTDWQIVEKVARLSPGTIGLAFLSGVFALVYNVLQYFLVQTLSATHAAFAGNFNKAATIGLAILVGLEKVPPGAAGIVMMLAILGNIIAFTIYNVLKSKSGKKAH